MQLELEAFFWFTDEMADCVVEAGKTATTVGGTMATVATALVGFGSFISAPVTGGASLVAGAAVTGAIAGAAATGVRSLAGKPCKSPATDVIKQVNSTVKEVSGAIGAIL